MIDPPRVSVCLITYRHERYIEQAVRSVLEQKTSFPLEIVVGEDVSPDRTRDVLQKIDRDFPGRLTLLLRDSNLGMQANFIATYAKCRGELIAMLEGDDYWTDPHKLQRQVDALDQHPDWTGCFHQAEYVDPAGRPLGKRHPFAYREPVTFDDLCRTNWVPTCSLIVRKSAVPQIPEWFRELPIGDWALCLLAAMSGPLGMVPEALACYRVHPGGVWTSQSHKVRVKGLLRAYGTIAEHLPPEFTLRVLKGLQDFGEQILDDREAVAHSLSHRLGRLLVGPLAWLHTKWYRRRYRRLWYKSSPCNYT
jgi:glycosyltransferase involved in cell wall biosynthesis